MRIIKQNLFWAFFYNMALIPVAAGLLYPAFREGSVPETMHFLLWDYGFLNPMLAALAMARPPQENQEPVATQIYGSETVDIAAPQQTLPLINTFKEALKKSQSNVTESEEPEILGTINRYYVQAFQGDPEATLQTIQAIAKLSQVNRDAMEKADQRARQLGNAGAWGVVFMAALLFLASLLFLRSLRKNLIQPLEEIHAVTLAVRHDDHMRRCTGTHHCPKDIRVIFTELNELLDQYTAERLHQKIGQ